MNKLFIFVSISFLSIAISIALFNLSKITKYSMNFIYQWKVSNYKQYIDVDINKYYEQNQFEEDKIKNNMNEIKKPTSQAENASFVIDIFLGLAFLSLPLLHHYNVAKKYEKLIVIICCLSGLIGLILTFYNYCEFDLKNEIYEKKYIIKKYISSFNEFIKNKIYKPRENIAFSQEEEEEPINNNNFLYANKDSKIPFFMDFQNNEDAENENNNNNLVRNYSLLRLFLCLILISLNLGLGISGYILYKNGGKTEKKEVPRIKKFRQKKH
jgi:hypothetical protein